MWGQADLKKTRAYQEAKQEGYRAGREEVRAEEYRAGREEVRQEILQITVPLLLDKGMTIEDIAQHFKLPIETLQKFASQK